MPDMRDDPEARGERAGRRPYLRFRESRQLPSEVCFPKKFDSALPTENATDPLAGITVPTMNVRHGSPLWLTLWSLLALREIMQVDPLPS